MPRLTPLPRLMIRLRADELAALKAEAIAAGLATSALAASFVRSCLGAPFDPGGELRAALRHVAEELRRVGVNLNQVARALNEARPVRDEHVLAAVVDLAQAVQNSRGLYLDMLRSRRKNLRRALSAAADEAEAAP